MDTEPTTGGETMESAAPLFQRAEWAITSHERNRCDIAKNDLGRLLDMARASLDARAGERAIPELVGACVECGAPPRLLRETVYGLAVLRVLRGCGCGAAYRLWPALTPAQEAEDTALEDAARVDWSRTDTGEEPC